MKVTITKENTVFTFPNNSTVAGTREEAMNLLTMGGYSFKDIEVLMDLVDRLNMTVQLEVRKP